MIGNFLNQAFAYLRYKRDALNLHGVHSPFVYQFNNLVLNTEHPFYDFAAIEEIRNELLKNNSLITITDFGAGSRTHKSNERCIKSIAKNALKPKEFSQLFFRIINQYQYQHILELGTSLGITTSYKASANKKARVITLEGCPTIASIAAENFKRLNLQNITQMVGPFSSTLPKLVHPGKKFDFIFIDGNHQFEPTLEYVDTLEPLLNEGGCLILDDIYWSKGMTKAWEIVKNKPEFTISIDLFSVGLLFKHPGKIKEHFTLRFPYF
ncbi:MAG: O-methyltransferase [Luteibaculaceae bacterium]